MIARHENVQLIILHYIRQKGAMSLFDLYNALFGPENSVSHSDKHFFPEHLVELEKYKFIKIRIKKRNAFELLSEQENGTGEKDICEILQAALWRLRYPDAEQFENADDPKNIFISVTNDFETVRDLLGFSVTDEVKQMQEQARRVEIFGEIKHKIKSDVFVIMPFSKRLRQVYEKHIKTVCDELKYDCRRADAINSPNIIANDIFSSIYNAKIIVCDCTGKNPNVFYELGIAHTLGKKVICITKNMQDIPFDIEHIRYIKYKNSPRGMKEFEQALKRFLEECP